MTRLLVLGDLNLDVHAEEPRPTAPGGETRSVVRIVPGGSAGTFARTARRLGAEVLFLGAVGRDAAGDLLERDLVTAGIEAHLRRSDRPTGAVLALLRGGDRSMICARGANDALDEDAVDDALLRDLDHVHVSGYALLSESQARAAQRASALARAAGATVSINAPPASLIEAFGVDEMLRALAGADVLILNRDEGHCLTGRTSDDDIVATLARRHRSGALTLGADGALAWQAGKQAAARPPRRLNVDPTGAGDVFAAVFVVRLLENIALAAAVEEACHQAFEHLAARTGTP